MTDVLVTGPDIDPQAWIAPGASVVGDVQLGPLSSIWYGCVLRGDCERITVGTRSNTSRTSPSSTPTRPSPPRSVRTSSSGTG